MSTRSGCRPPSGRMIRRSCRQRHPRRPRRHTRPATSTSSDDVDYHIATTSTTRPPRRPHRRFRSSTTPDTPSSRLQATSVRMPVSRYETVGFHESGHDGAFQLEVVDLDDCTTLASRPGDVLSNRRRHVARVDEPVMAPIDGTVIRAGSYTLYCDHTDNFVVIEPSGRRVELRSFIQRVAGRGRRRGKRIRPMIGTGGRICPLCPGRRVHRRGPSNPHVHLGDRHLDSDRPSSGGCWFSRSIRRSIGDRHRRSWRGHLGAR